MFLALSVLVAFCLASFIKGCRKFWPLINEKIPSYPGQLPLIGHLHTFTTLFKIDGLYQFLASHGNFAIQNDGVTKFMIGPMPIYFVADPEDVQTVLNRCLEKPNIYKLVYLMLGKSIVAAEVPIWKRNRRILDLGFKQHLIDEYLEVFIEQADVLVEKLEEDVGRGEVDLTNKIARTVLETACRTVMGARPNGKEQVTEQYMKATHEFLEIMSIRIWRPWLLIEPIYNMSSYKERSMKAAQTVYDLTEEMVRLRTSKHLQRLQNNGNVDYESRRFKSILDILLETCVTEKGSLYTHEELRNIVDNVLFASFDTSLYEILFVLVCIGSYPAVQEKIYEEISQILSEDAKVSRHNISYFTYLDAAIKEALRLYPVGMIVARQTTVDTKLRNVTIPANNIVVVHLWAANRHTKYWGSDANEFKPERWLSPDTHPNHQAAFASFSPGRRGCIAKSYALLNIRATIIPILRKYKLTADQTRLKLDMQVMLHPISGHYIKLERR